MSNLIRAQRDLDRAARALARRGNPTGGKAVKAKPRKPRRGPFGTYGTLEVDWADMRRGLRRARATERLDGTWRKGVFFGEFLGSLEPPEPDPRYGRTVPSLSQLSREGRTNLGRLEADARRHLGPDVDIVDNEGSLEAAITTHWPETGEDF